MVGLDLDPQASLAEWSTARASAGTAPVVPVTATRLVDWRTAAATTVRDLMILDCPPGVDAPAGMGALVDLAAASDLTLMPAPPRGLDLKAAARLGATLGAVFVLNKVERGPNAEAARSYLGQLGEVCPVAIPRRVDLITEMGGGGAVLDRSRLGGAAEMLALWRWAASRLELA